MANFSLFLPRSIFDVPWEKPGKERPARRERERRVEVSGGANLRRISFTLLASNFDFLFSYVDVDFKEKIQHPHLSRKSSTLTNSKREKEEMPDVAAKEVQTSRTTTSMLVPSYNEEGQFFGDLSLYY